MTVVSRGSFFFGVRLRNSDLLQVAHVASDGTGIPFQVRSLRSLRVGMGPRAALVPGPPRE